MNKTCNHESRVDVKLFGFVCILSCEVADRMKS